MACEWVAFPPDSGYKPGSSLGVKKVKTTMELLPLCPTYACLSFVLPGHRYCLACERALQTRPPVEEQPYDDKMPLRASA